MPKVILWSKQAADWLNDNDIIDHGEPAFEVDTGRVKIGRDSQHWNDLPYVGIGSVELFSASLAADRNYNAAPYEVLASLNFTLPYPAFCFLRGRAIFQSWAGTAGSRRAKLKLQLDAGDIGDIYSRVAHTIAFFEDTALLNHATVLAAGNYDLDLLWTPTDTASTLYCSPATYPGDYYAKAEVIAWYL